MRPRRESGGIETISRESRKKSAEVSEKWEKEREGALTKDRPENCGQRASLAVLGCLGLEQQNSWNLSLQNVEQLKWILSQTGGDGEETNHSCPPLSPASSCA